MVIDRDDDTITGYVNGSNAPWFHDRQATTSFPGAASSRLSLF